MTLPLIDLPRTPKGVRFDVRAVVDGRLEVRAEAGVISIFDSIGLDVTEARVGAALRQIGPRPVVVEINSDGGDYWVGGAIYNQLRRHGQPITVQVLGRAASAASLIAMAGDRIEMARNAMMMVHNPWNIAIGDAALMEENAALLRKIERSAAEIYAARSGLEITRVQELMDAETFMTAEEAINHGFADDLLARDALPAMQSAHPSLHSRRDLEECLQRVGLTKMEASRVSAAGWPALGHHEPDIDLAAIAACITTNTASLRAAIKGA